MGGTCGVIMGPRCCAVLLWWLVVTCVVLGAQARASSYVAAVLQHSHVGNDLDPRKSLLDNLDVYDKYMSIAKAAGAQILVTPEVGLGHLELGRAVNKLFGEFVPPVGVNPCQSQAPKHSPAVMRASCLARAHELPLLVGMVNLQPCEPSSDPRCPSDGTYVYNSALVFHEDGTLAAVYDKEHLFSVCPDCFDPAPPSEAPVIYKSSFGVDFGVMYSQPVDRLLERGVRNFLFPTSWENVPPILTATTFQQAFSRRYNVSLLAANNGHNLSKSGSGIYSSGRVLASFFDPDLKEGADEKLLLAEVPLLPTVDTEATGQGEALPDGARVRADAEAAAEATADEGRLDGGGAPGPLCGFLPCVILPRTPHDGFYNVTAGGVTCVASLNMPQASDHYYALVAHDGMLWFGERLDLQLCGVVRCMTELACTLPDPYDHSVYAASGVFERLLLQANFHATGNHTEVRMFPLLATAQGALLPPTALRVDASGNAMEVHTDGSPLFMAMMFTRPLLPGTTATEANEEVPKSGNGWYNYYS